MPVLEGTSDSVLAAGFGHYDGSVRAGGVGNYALAGHRVTHGEPLRDMPDLRPGDEIVVETRRTVFTYRLDTGGDDLVVPFSASWVLDPLPTNPDGGVQPPGPVTRPAADHAHDVLGAVPHRPPAGRLRPPGLAPAADLSPTSGGQPRRRDRASRTPPAARQASAATSQARAGPPVLGRSGPVGLVGCSTGGRFADGHVARVAWPVWPPVTTTWLTTSPVGPGRDRGGEHERRRTADAQRARDGCR